MANEYFYYIGIAYILSNFWNLFSDGGKDTSGPDMFKNIAKSVPNHIGDVDMELVKKTSTGLKGFAVKKFIALIFSLFLFVWLIYGCVSTEHPEFFLIIASSALCVIIPVWKTLNLSLRSNEFIVKAFVKNFPGVMESKAQRILYIMDNILGIVLAGHVLYLHFVLV